MKTINSIKKAIALLMALLCLVLSFTGCGFDLLPDTEPSLETTQPAEVTQPTTTLPSDTEPSESSEYVEPIEKAKDDPQVVANYIREYGELPDFYIKKEDAVHLGWISNEGNLWDVAPGRVIGGNRFGNYEKALPDSPGRKWYECDVNYKGGFRGSERILYSNDGLIYYTCDHYETFIEM